MTVGKQNEAFTTPFQPIDYNLKRWRFLFSKEYLDEHKITLCCEDSDTTVSEEWNNTPEDQQIPAIKEEQQT